MSINFVKPQFSINNTSEDGTLTFYKNGFWINKPNQNGYKNVTVSGNGSVTLTNAIENGLNYVKLFGECEQSTTPTPANPVNIICNNGIIKARMSSGLPLGYKKVDSIRTINPIDLGIKTNQDMEYELEFEKLNNNNQYIYSSDSGSTLTTNTTAYIASAGNWRFGNKTASMPFSSGIYSSKQNKEGIWINGEKTRDYDYEGTFESTNTLKLFSPPSSGTPTSPVLTLQKLIIKDYSTKEVLHNYIPCIRYDNIAGVYDIIDNEFYTNTEQDVVYNTIEDSIEIYTDGTTEKIEVDTTGDYALAQNLLAVGNYKDVQNITKGIITNNIAIGVLTGEEEWEYDSQYSRFDCVYEPDSIAQPNGTRSIPAFCTHFKMLSNRETISSITAGQGYIVRVAGQYSRLYLHSNLTSVAAFKQFIIEQNISGNPIIIIYPIGTPTTSTTTHQQLNIQNGTNTIEITQASINNLPIEAGYKASIGE